MPVSDRLDKHSVLPVSKESPQGKMKNKTSTVNDNRKKPSTNDKKDSRSMLLRIAGWVGLVIATPFFLWAPLGLTGLIPSMIDVFGVVGLRIPAAVTIAGLLLAAIGFHRV
jgi:hypothetical protein